MDAFIAILRARRENVHVNFHCGVFFFLCNQDVRACMMGCKKRFNINSADPSVALTHILQSYAGLGRFGSLL